MRKPHITYHYPYLASTQLPARRLQADVSGCWWNDAGEPTARGITESRRLYEGLEQFEQGIAARGWQGWPK